MRFFSQNILSSFWRPLYAVLNTCFPGVNSPWTIYVSWAYSQCLVTWGSGDWKDFLKDLELWLVFLNEHFVIIPHNFRGRQTLSLPFLILVTLAFAPSSKCNYLSGKLTPISLHSQSLLCEVKLSSGQLTSNWEFFGCIMVFPHFFFRKLLGRDSIHDSAGITVNEKQTTVGIHFRTMMKCNQFVTNIIIW